MSINADMWPTMTAHSVAINQVTQQYLPDKVCLKVSWLHDPSQVSPAGNLLHSYYRIGCVLSPRSHLHFNCKLDSLIDIYRMETRKAKCLNTAVVQEKKLRDHKARPASRTISRTESCSNTVCLLRYSWLHTFPDEFLGQRCVVGCLCMAYYLYYTIPSEEIISKRFHIHQWTEHVPGFTAVLDGGSSLRCCNMWCYYFLQQFWIQDRVNVILTKEILWLRRSVIAKFLS